MDELFLIDQSKDPVKVFFIYDFPVIRIVQRAGPVLFQNLLPDFFDQLVFYRMMAVNIVWSHTSLSAVQIFSKNNTSCGKFEISSLIHDTGTFAAQLQSNGCQMLCGISHHFFSYGLASGEENIVKMFPEETGIFCPSSGDYSRVLWIKALRKNLPYHIAGMRGIGAGFYNCSIPRRQSVGQRRKGQHKGVVPGTHDQCYSIRRRLFIAVRMELG